MKYFLNGINKITLQLLGPVLFLFVFSLKAQLTVNGNLTPTQLVQNVLLGAGIVANNIVYTGSASAIGSFVGTASNIGLASGILMTTGNITNAIGPNNSTGKSTQNNSGGDVDLAALSGGGAILDACILQFNFIPTTNTVNLTFVFGSEEYPEYTQYADIFGFFISGPGIAGPYSNNAKNIAVIPGTVTPISIANICTQFGGQCVGGNNVQYLINNNNGTSIQYDAFSIPITMTANVQCGQTYTIKIAIGDKTDRKLDTGVFLQAAGFTAGAKATAGTDIQLNVGCTGTSAAANFTAGTIAWNSIFPGAIGDYNSYLSCTTCLNPDINYPIGAPNFIDFQVCGTGFCNLNTCDTLRVNYNPAIVAAITPVNPVMCFGQATTTITAVASGGSPPYTYLWNNSFTTQSITVGNGIWQVAISDASGCTPAVANVNITTFPAAIAANAGADISVCNQNPAATITASVQGALGGIWSGGAGTYGPNNATLAGLTYTPAPAELAAGFVDLTLTTTGNGNCAAATDIVRINYVGFTGLATFVITPITCFGGNDGSALVSVPGSTPTYSYFWNTVPPALTNLASNLSSGTYMVTITDDLGCTSDFPVTIPDPLPTPLLLASQITNVSCIGGNNGTIAITITNGTAPYTYLWSNGGNTPQISNLSIQNYTVTVTDSKLCQAIATYTITEPAAISILLTPSNVNCFNANDGAITSIVSGGTAPYTYNWDNGTTAPDPTGLAIGNFILTVTDNLGCVSQPAIATITEPTQLTANTTTTNETCNYLNDGSATATQNGGTPGYTYAWSNGAITPQITNVAAQQYTLTVTDLNGCTALAFATITEPTPLNINFINQVNVSCFQGTNAQVTANATGGTFPYTYLWTPSNSTIPNNTNLTAGIYTLTVTDNNACVIVDAVTITEPASNLTISISSSPNTCFGGSNGTASSIASGGTAPFSYHWMPGNFLTQNITNLTSTTYTVDVIDFNGCISNNNILVDQAPSILLSTSSINSNCNLSNGQATVTATAGIAPYSYLWSPAGGTNNIATGLGSGAYSVLVTDFMGCTNTGFLNVDENTAPSVNIAAFANASCFGQASGSATVTASGGIAPYTYLWLPTGGTNALANNLMAGSYTVSVTGANGCEALLTLIPEILQPTEISIDVTQNNISCFGGNDGNASANASGGTPGYIYQWLPTGTLGANINNLIANTYTIEATDALGCVKSQPFTITEPTQLSSSIVSATNANCNGTADGAATVNVSGGSLPYSYNWLPNGGNGFTGSGLSAGTYTVTTTDIKNCIVTSNATIAEPLQALSANSTETAVSCFGLSDGTSQINVSGGTAGYSYQWFPNVSNTNIALNLNNGNYTVLITDSKNCQKNIAVNIIEPQEITGNLVAINPSCNLPNGSLTALISGGNPPYTFTWSVGGSITPQALNLGVGTYSLTINDASNCILTLSKTLTATPNPTIAVTSMNNVSCFNGNDGNATISISQGTPPFVTNWTPTGGNALTGTNLSANNYTVNVIDGLGCLVSENIILTAPLPVSVAVITINDVLCFGGNTGEITVSGSGGTGPLYNYSWTPVISNASTISNLPIGTYTVNVTDQNNCFNTISVNISEPALLSSSVGIITNAACFNGLGGATINTLGGTVPYSYAWSAPAAAQNGNQITDVLAGTYAVTVTDINGCVANNNVLITQPSQIITSSGLNDTLCLGQTGSISASAFGGAGNYTYQWQPSAAINTGTLAITPLDNTIYTVVAFDQNGCVGTPAFVSAIVYNLSGSTVQTYASSPICPGQNSNVLAETAAAAGPITFQWNNNLGTGPGVFVVTPAVPTSYICTFTNICGLTISDTVNVLFNPIPIIDISSDTNMVCIPGVIYFYDSSSVLNEYDSITVWSWNFGDGTFSNIENPVHYFNQSATFPVSLTVTTAQGCTNNNLLFPDSIYAFPYPIAAFSVNASNISLPFDKLNCTNLSTGGITYQWDFGDNETSTLTNPTHTYTTVGLFPIQLIAMSDKGCLDTTIISITANADIIFPNAFTPNEGGATGGFYDINSLENDVFFAFCAGAVEYKLVVFNRWGEIIFETENIKQGWDGYYNNALCNQDVYIWKATITLNDGTLLNKGGDVTILKKGY